jgi:hypothetical protein
MKPGPKTGFRGTAEERFWQKVYKTDSCWFWIGSKSAKGYGHLIVGKGNIYAHKFSWMIHRGDIPTGQQVLHHCDIRQCVNPNHLFLGTQADNLRDAGQKGTMYRPQPSAFSRGRAGRPAEAA